MYIYLREHFEFSVNGNTIGIKIFLRYFGVFPLFCFFVLGQGAWRKRIFIDGHAKIFSGGKSLMKISKKICSKSCQPAGQMGGRCHRIQV